MKKVLCLAFLFVLSLEVFAATKCMSREEIVEDSLKLCEKYHMKAYGRNYRKCMEEIFDLIIEYFDREGRVIHPFLFGRNNVGARNAYFHLRCNKPMRER